MTEGPWQRTGGRNGREWQGRCRSPENATDTSSDGEASTCSRAADQSDPTDVNDQTATPLLCKPLHLKAKSHETGILRADLQVITNTECLVADRRSVAAGEGAGASLQSAAAREGMNQVCAVAFAATDADVR